MDSLFSSQLPPSLRLCLGKLGKHTQASDVHVQSDTHKYKFTNKVFSYFDAWLQLPLHRIILMQLTAFKDFQQ